MNQSMSLEPQTRIVAEAIEGCSLPSVDGMPFRFQESEHMDRAFGDLGFDSLATMEFCIAIHCATGVELTLEDIVRLQTPRRISQHLASL